MKFLIKTIGSTILGMTGGWLGNFLGFGTGLFLGLIFSIIGWYWTKYLLDKYLP